MSSKNSELKLWVENIWRGKNATALQAEEISGGSGCGTWDCRLDVAGKELQCVLKIFKKKFDDYSGLGALKTARKNLFASKEFAEHKILIPKILGHCEAGEEAAIAAAKISKTPIDDEACLKAATQLARLHAIVPSALSGEFYGLIKSSKPNRERIRSGVIQYCQNLHLKHPQWRSRHGELHRSASRIVENPEPKSGIVSIVHGDYFTRNLLFDGSRCYIIDWDLLALGDPMWDLGFLCWADPKIKDSQAGLMIKAYSNIAPVEWNILNWHQGCWKAFWELRKLLQNSGK